MITSPKMTDPATSIPIHPSLITNILGTRCALESCLSEKHLYRCVECEVVHYCSPEHQTAHQHLHESICSNIKTRRSDLEKTEADLRTAASNDDISEDVFYTAVGQVWKHNGTHSFMKAKFDFQNALLLVNTQIAAELALKYCMDMLHLDRSDNLSVRDIVPALLLRLGREQECYDFIKWWATLRKRYKHQGGYNWNDQSLPYLDIKNADAFETVAELDLHRMGLSHAVALTLLKIRLRLDIAEFTATCDTLVDGLHARKVRELVGRRMALENVVSASKLEKSLVRQLKTCYQAVHKIHPYLWEHFFRDATPDFEGSGFISPGSPEEARLVREQSARAWEETEDARMVVEVDVPQCTSTRPLRNLDGPKNVVALSWGSSGGSDGCHESLAAAISVKATFQNYTSLEASRGPFSNLTTDGGILITNDGPLDDANIVENIVERIIGGQITILCGQYSKNTSNTQFRTLMKRLNLPWQRSTEATEVGRLDAAIGMPPGFPNTYKPKAVCLKHVSTANIWYVGDTPRDAAVVLKQVGRGRLGYVGDTGDDPVSDQIILAMCGFKFDLNGNQ